MDSRVAAETDIVLAWLLTRWTSPLQAPPFQTSPLQTSPLQILFWTGCPAISAPKRLILYCSLHYWFSTLAGQCPVTRNGEFGERLRWRDDRLSKRKHFPPFLLVFNWIHSEVFGKDCVYIIQSTNVSFHCIFCYVSLKWLSAYAFFFSSSVHYVIL